LIKFLREANPYLGLSPEAIDVELKQTKSISNQNVQDPEAQRKMNRKKQELANAKRIADKQRRLNQEIKKASGTPDVPQM
jgi:hypothetical protein